MKIGLKLAISFFLIASASMLLVGIISFHKAKKSLHQESFNKLTAVRELKAIQLEEYFKLIKDQIITLSEDPMITDAMKEFTKGFQNIDKELSFDSTQMEEISTELDSYFETEYLPRLNKNTDEPVKIETESTQNKNTRILQNFYIANNPHPTGEKQKFDFAEDKSTYGKAHKLYHPVLRKFLERFGIYDIFLADTSGTIVYTVFKDVDFGTSLMDGPFKETNLADVFRAVNSSNEKNYVKIADLKPYHPESNAPASFIGVSVFEKGKKIGALIFQTPIGRVNDIMTNNHRWSEIGLGMTGETYVVAGDFTLRNRIRSSIEDTSVYYGKIKASGMPLATQNKIKKLKNCIGIQEIKTQGTIAALSGKTGLEIFTDYEGDYVLSAYRPLKIEGLHWVIMSEIDEVEAFQDVDDLRRYVIYTFFGFFVVVIGISIFISRRITKPIKELTNDAMELAKGNLDVEIVTRGNDEIGVLSQSFKKMQISIRNLIEELKHINQNLEHKVVERTVELQREKEMVEHKNKEIVDSINYAKRLQDAILPKREDISKHLPHNFVLFKPKDIVSGDFYWMYPMGDEILIAAVDCTGHGVPGAMVSVVGANSLDRCVKEFQLKNPAEIMDKMSELVSETFDTENKSVKDGMDMTMCSVNFKTKKIQFAGANNPLWIMRKGTEKVEEVKADKQPIGQYEFRKPFTNHTFDMKDGDCIYLLSDGYADQFGGPDGKKFKYKTLRDLLLEIHEQPMEKQLEVLENEFLKWKSGYEQVDDVCIIGIKI